MASLPPNQAGTAIHTYQSASTSLLDVGIFKDTLFPSFSLHGSLALLAYAGGRFTDRLETKDILWPSSQVINAWWSAVGRRLIAGVPPDRIWGILSRPERLMLIGVTLWGGRLFYRIVSRALKRGADEPRYEAAKNEEGFWNKALFTIFLPEAVFQTVICLPFTAPFRHQGAVLTGYHPAIQALSVGVFTAGFALEVIADYQLDAFRAERGESAKTQMLKEGVWSLCRHPNYLGDVLVHFSFPLMLYASDLLAPIELLGPIANYIFLRYVGGDKENEAHQVRRYSMSNPEKMEDFTKYRQTKNSVWPDAQQFSNQWAWVVIGCGAVGVAVEALIDSYI
jgi:steroid 5-alpha reductase family enzyme